MNTTRLYVGGISWNTNDEGLRSAFMQAGNVVSASVLVDRMTNRSRGFGFVEMGSADEANAAIEMWNGKDLDGRQLTVNIARDREERPQGGQGGFAGRSNGGGYDNRGPRDFNGGGNRGGFGGGFGGGAQRSGGFSGGRGPGRTGMRSGTR